jgi:hypothetical protein
MANEPTPSGRWNVIYSGITGITAPGHYEAPTGTSEESQKAGHEADRFDAKGILMVPVLVVVVTFLSYLLVTGLFEWLKPGKPYHNDIMSPLAVEKNEIPLNDKLAKISLNDPKAETQQPRLEGLKVMDTHRDGSAKPDPMNYRSFQPAVKENSYYLTPQDLYPSRFVDPLTGQHVLDEYAWVSKEKRVARIPVDEAMKRLAGMLPAKKDGAAPAGKAAKQSNGGQTPPPVKEAP